MFVYFYKRFRPRETGLFWNTDESKLINIYDGEFLNGRMHGQGKMTYSDRTIKEGLW